MFSGDCVGLFGAEEKIEVAGERRSDGLDAAGAEDFEVSVVAGAEADIVYVRALIAVLDKQVCGAFDRKRAYLAKLGGVVEGAGLNGFLYLKRFVD
jgi:hypothetical protein